MKRDRYLPGELNTLDANTTATTRKDDPAAGLQV
jgi:hypothetical protein